MKKNGLLIVVIIVIILLAFGGYMFMNQSQNKTSTGNSGQNGSGGVINSIKDALSQSMSLECNYEDTANGTKVQAYIKNGAVRTNFQATDPKNSGSAIIKDKMMYFWTSQGGFMMTVPEGDEPKSQGQAEGTSDPDAVIEEIEKYKESCKNAVVSDSLFTPPSDVKFQDLSKMMQTPTGSKSQTQMPSQEDIENMMKQYSDQ